ncbi:unnamed protein product [Lactuca saligna]|uniref:Uncharacterized protein n=1 Tax=Lactuca saligna TaxID=75948 RepID=A0AA36E6Q9_LACSI|nr:unnamed protein product [Lactuca saligna]
MTLQSKVQGRSTPKEESVGGWVVADCQEGIDGASRSPGTMEVEVIRVKIGTTLNWKETELRDAALEGDDRIVGRKREEGHRLCRTWMKTDDRSPVARSEKDDRLWVVVVSGERRGHGSFFFFGCVFSRANLELKALIIFFVTILLI